MIAMNVCWRIAIFLLVAICLYIPYQAKSESYSDLLVGFTTQSGSDIIYDLGSLTALTDGQTWSAGTLGISVGNVNNCKWGVVGDDYAANGSVAQNTLWTTDGVVPSILINGGSKFNSIDSSISSIFKPILDNGWTNYTVSAGDANSWNNQTISGALTTQYHNAYVNPNTIGVTSNYLYEITDQNIPAVPVGVFSLSSNGTLTFNLVASSSPPLASFQSSITSGFAPLFVLFTNTSTGSYTNSVWNFGDGRSVTNTDGSAVTNIYASAGSFTVSLIVTGPGGSSTNTVPNYITATNLPPVANWDAYTVAENTTNAFCVTTNDVVNAAGGYLTIVSVNATNGTASIVNGTNIVFAPTNGLATGTVGYTITDNVGGTNSAVLTVNFTNIAPLANPDSYTVAENTTNTFGVTTNDVVRTTGGWLSIVSVNATNGTASVVNGTNITFMPTNGLATGTVGYTITDNVGGTNSAVLTVNFTNIAPLAALDAYTVAENTTNTFSVTTNDSARTIGGWLSIVSVSATNGTASIANGTNIVFAPTNGLATGTVGYTITDNVGGTNVGLLTVNFTNIAPVANPDAYTVAENTTNTFSVTTNDTVRTTGGWLSIVSVSATNGTASVVNGTNIVFAPTNGLATGTVGYTITDNVGGTNSAVLTVNFTNIAPLANPDSYTVAENTTNTFGVTTNDSVRTTGGWLSIVSVSATNGLASIVNGTNILFAPTNGLAAGTVGYTITDNVGGTNSSLLTVNFTNLPPVAGLVGAPTNGIAPLLVNFTNLSTGAITNWIWNFGDGHSITNGSGATVANTYTGQGVYTVSLVVNGPGGSSTNTLANAITTHTNPVALFLAAPTNGVAPLAVSFTNLSTGTITNCVWNFGDGHSVTNGAGLNVTNTYIGQGVYTVSLVVNGPGGSSTNTLTNGITTYTNPVAGFVASPTNGLVPLPVTFTNTSSGTITNWIWNFGDGTIVTNLAGGDVNYTYNTAGNFTVTLVVNGPGGSSTNTLTNGITTSYPAQLAIFTGTPTSGLVPLTVGFTNVSSGIITNWVWNFGDGRIITNSTAVNVTNTYVSPGSFTVSLTVNGPSGSTTNRISNYITVTNLPPLTVADVYTVAENTTNTFSVTTNDVVRAAGGYLTIVSLSATNGLASVVNGTNIVFAPTNGLATGTVGYTVTDNVGGTNSSILVVNFTNIAPIATLDSYTVAENTTNTFSVTTNDSARTVGGWLSIVSVSATNGLASVVNGTNIVFAPTNGLATGTVGYTITDNVGGTNSAVLTVNFTNIAPVANPDVYTVAENTTNTFSVTTNDVVRTTGGWLSIVSVSATNGTANVVNGTNIVFAPTNGLAVGTVGYTITDNVGGTNSGLLTVLFTNTPPVANADVFTVAENTTNTFSVTTNDVVRTAGGYLTIVSVSATNGTASIANGTNIVFAPTNGLAAGTVGYTITDNVGGTNSTVLTVNFTNVAPVAVFSGGPTNGFVPLPAAFTNASAGSITNYIWNFGDGHAITNSTGVTVTNIYAASGSFTVSLVVRGPGGSSTNTITNYVTAVYPAPVAGFVAGPVDGFAPLTVVFTNTSTGYITNGIWNFGDGRILTNGAVLNGTNTYIAAGSYSVSLIVNGPGGSSTNTLVNGIGVFATPRLVMPVLSGGKLVFSGTNCPAGVQYRILTTTNIALPSGSWTPVWTNIFSGAGSFGYTNSMTNAAAFFKLVSP